MKILDSRVQQPNIHAKQSKTTLWRRPSKIKQNSKIKIKNEIKKNLTARAPSCPQAGSSIRGANASRVFDHEKKKREVVSIDLESVCRLYDEAILSNWVVFDL